MKILESEYVSEILAIQRCMLTDNCCYLYRLDLKLIGNNKCNWLQGTLCYACYLNDS